MPMGGGRGRGMPHPGPAGMGGPDMSGAQFAAISAFRTGNIVMDMIIAMLIPAFFSALFSTHAKA